MFCSPVGSNYASLWCIRGQRTPQFPTNAALTTAYAPPTTAFGDETVLPADQTWDLPRHYGPTGERSNAGMPTPQWPKRLATS